MKTKFYIILFAFFIIGCESNPTETMEFSDSIEFIGPIPISRLEADFPEIKKMNDIDSLIAGMVEKDCVYSRSVGWGGQYTRQYACFERLCELKNGEELLELTKHENPVVRMYGLKALENENSTYLSQAREQLKNDTSIVYTFSGCIKMGTSIGSSVKFDLEREREKSN